MRAKDVEIIMNILCSETAVPGNRKPEIGWNYSFHYSGTPVSAFRNDGVNSPGILTVHICIVADDMDFTRESGIAFCPQTLHSVVKGSRLDMVLHTPLVISYVAGAILYYKDGIVS